MSALCGEGPVDRRHRHPAVLAGHDVAHRCSGRLGRQLHGVGPQPEAQRLHAEDLGHGDVGQVDVGPAVAHEPHRLVLPGRLEHHPLHAAGIDHRGDDVLADGAGGVVDADRPALPALGEDPAGAGGQVAGDLLGPVAHEGWSAAFLAPTSESTVNRLAAEADQVVLLVGPDRAPRLATPRRRGSRRRRPSPGTRRPAAAPRPPPAACRRRSRECRARQRGQLGLDARVEVGRAPSELPDVDVLTAGLEDARQLAGREALVEHMGDADRPGLRRALGKLQRERRSHKSYGRELSTLVQTGERSLMDLGHLVEALRANPGLRNKAPIALVREVFGAGDWLAGPGDDGARRRRLPRGGRRGHPAGVRGRRPLRRRHGRGAGQRQRPGGHGRRPPGHRGHRRGRRRRGPPGAPGHALRVRALRRAHRRRPPHPPRRPAGAVGLRAGAGVARPVGPQRGGRVRA